MQPDLAPIGHRQGRELNVRAMQWREIASQDAPGPLAFG
jgi:hypothetical protein